MEIFDSIVGDNIGLVHLISSFLSMLFGLLVLCTKKGTITHKRMGYLYTLNMIIVLVTALMIYRLFNKFGPFHIIAVIGSIYLVCGILPAFLRFKNWIKIHEYFMYWSVIGLYAAFFAEIAVRKLKSNFWWMVGIGALLVTIFGGLIYGRNKKSWFDINKINQYRNKSV